MAEECGVCGLREMSTRLPGARYNCTAYFIVLYRVRDGLSGGLSGRGRKQAVPDQGFFRNNLFRLVQTLAALRRVAERSEEHTSELQSLMRISYAVFCLKKKNDDTIIIHYRCNLSQSTYRTQKQT